jgi:ribonucleoside-diphosphate reductase alpha chain
MNDNALDLLKTRYLNNGESVNQMFRRVANSDDRYEKLMSDLYLIPNSPALFNAGLNNGCTSSACFEFDIDDCMLRNDDGSINENSIVRTREKAVSVAKAGGGVGYFLSNLRARNSPIKSVHRKACGPVLVLRDLHAISHLITQGGKRELAQMGILNVDHPDIRDFIHCKDKDPQGLGSFNISVGWFKDWVTRAFDVPESNERKIWDEQCTSAWSHGCPGMFFPDTVNLFHNPNPHLGKINGTNPCGEVPLRSNEPCNLASVVLPRYFNKGNRDINWNLLEEKVRVGVDLMDDILDRNTFPHPLITEAALLTRKLGMGGMGWADLLAMCHIHYDTTEALILAEKLMRFINDVAHDQSERLAVSKGPYPGWSDRSKHSMRRNETNTSIAPTGSISIIGGCPMSQSIEPHPYYKSERVTAEGHVYKDEVDWEAFDGFRPKLARDIDPEWHVRMQASFQAHTDLGVSKTINMRKDATQGDVSKAYKLMHDLQCCGGTIFREGCRDEQVIREQKTGSVYRVEKDVPTRRRMPVERDAKIIEMCITDHKKFFLHCGQYDDGTLGEIFVTADFGTTIAGLLDAFCITFSVALQNGVPLTELVSHHKNKRFEPAGMTSYDGVPLCTSICDLIVRVLEKRYLTPPEKEAQVVEGIDLVIGSGMLCPECSTETIYQGGQCQTCPNPTCRWTKCG